MMRVLERAIRDVLCIAGFYTGRWWDAGGGEFVCLDCGGKDRHRAGWRILTFGAD
jgi:hypothetical protein